MYFFAFDLLTKDSYEYTITFITHVIERHTMKHTTQARSASKPSPKLRMVGLRLEDELMDQLEALAAAEQRSLAAMARICVRHGLRDIHNRIAAAQG